MEKNSFFIKIPAFYYGRRRTQVIQNVYPVLKKFQPSIVITEASVTYLSAWLLLMLRPIFKYKLVGWGHGTGNKKIDNPFAGINGKFRRFFYKKLDAFIFYSNGRKQVFEKYLNKIPLIVAPNTLDTNYLKKLYNKFELIGTKEMKIRLNLNKKYNLIFIGRLLKSKRIDLLLDTFLLLKKDLHDIALHIIGDGTELDQIKRFMKQTRDIYYYGSSYDDKKNGELLYCSDIFLMPGYVGLSVIHAMSFGCPVVTCNPGISGPFHSPEFEYIKHNQNGWIFKSDSNILANEIKEILVNKEMLKTVKKNAVRDIYKNAAVGKFMQGFSDVIKIV
ncbi:MAG: glycosyltransferase family 4 protein [Bacteroidales bacterium]|nr:glycosyltransferase family 4 protein [Bacteroidales bacterium]